MLTDKQREKIIARLAAEPSDTKLADKFGISRTTVRRIRHDELARQTKLKRAKSRLKTKESKMTKLVEQVQAPPVVVEPGAIAVAAPVPVNESTPIQPPPIVAETQPLPITPKVDAEPVTLGTYFAVQLLRGEQVKDVANAFMQAAETRGMLFRKLQVMDFVSVGTSSFVRFRSDLAEPASVLAALNRGFISFSEGNYRFTLSDGRQGIKFPTAIMCSVQKVGYGQTFAGPKLKRWAQQFATAS